MLGLLVDLEPAQAAMLERICSGRLITDAALRAAGAIFHEGHSSATAQAQADLNF